MAVSIISCEVNGCLRDHYGKGLCRLHYRRKYEGRDRQVKNCLWCKKELPDSARPDTKFCNRNCRMKHYRSHGGCIETRNCKQCGKDITDKRQDVRYCSKTCRNKQRSLRNGQKVIPDTLFCMWCEESFVPKSYHHTCCSNSCRYKFKKYGHKKPEKECLNCGKDITDLKQLAKFCGTDCSHIYHKEHTNPICAIAGCNSKARSNQKDALCHTHSCLIHRHNSALEREKIYCRTKARRAQQSVYKPPKEERIKIMGIYREAKRLTNITGIKHEVDHIIPLKHELVSGLHVVANLRIVTASENRHKSNKYKLF